MQEIEKRLELINVVFELNYNAGKILVDFTNNGMFDGLNCPLP